MLKIRLEVLKTSIGRIKIKIAATETKIKNLRGMQKNDLDYLEKLEKEYEEMVIKNK
jgi:hypothetical protein